MNNSQVIEPNIFVSIHPDVVKRVSTSNLVLSLSMLVGGMAAFIASFQMKDPSSTISMFLMVLGTALLLSGVFRLFWKSREMVYAPTGSVTKESTTYFDAKYQERLVTLLESGDFNSDMKIKGGNSGNLRLDVLISQDSKFAAVQLFQFIPYTYTPVTKVFYLTGAKAMELRTFLQHAKI